MRHIDYVLEMVCKDLRLLRFGFGTEEMCKRASMCLEQYVFPNKDDFVSRHSCISPSPIPCVARGGTGCRLSAVSCELWAECESSGAF
jgi:hypothetical protein